MESLREAASTVTKAKINPMDSYKQFMGGKGVQDAPPAQVTVPPEIKEEPVEVDLPDDEDMMMTGAINPTKVEAQDDEPPTDRPLLADP